MPRNLVRMVSVTGALFILLAVQTAEPVSVEGAARVDVRSVKGFVVARTAASLTLLAGERRVAVAIAPQTRVIGLRQRAADIALHDIVRAEGRWASANRLLADQLEVVVTAAATNLKRFMVTPTVEFTVVGE